MRVPAFVDRQDLLRDPVVQAFEILRALEIQDADVGVELLESDSYQPILEEDATALPRFDLQLTYFPILAPF